MAPSRWKLFFILKVLLAVVILVAVGWKFRQLLSAPELRDLTTIRFDALVLAGLLYLACHTLWGTFWVQLLRGQGVVVPWWVGIRAYFVSQLGKYVPGKAWVLLLRVGLLNKQQVRPAVVIVTGLYETLTNMAAGAILGVCLLPWSSLLANISNQQTYGLFALTLMPLGLLGLNRLIRRVAKKYRPAAGMVVPVPSLLLLLRGLLQATLGWCLLGLSLWLTVRGISVEPPPLTATGYIATLCGVCISYVIGFIVLVAPAGVGAREWVLQVVLARQFATLSAGDALAAAVAVLLRVVWTIAEAILAGILWFCIPKTQPTDAKPESTTNTALEEVA